MRINRLSQTCTSKGVVGKTLTLSASVSSGTPNYTVKFTRNGVDIPGSTSPPIGNNQPHTFVYSVTSADLPSVNIGTNVTDSCLSGQKTASEQCAIAIYTPICDWILGKGGPVGITIPGIFDLIYNYVYQSDYSSLGFIPVNQEIMGCVYYYLGFTASGNTMTGCNY